MAGNRERDRADHRAVLPDDEMDDVLAAVVDVTIRLDGEGRITAVADPDPSTLCYDPAALTGASVETLFAESVSSFDGSDTATFRERLLDGDERITAPVTAADGSVVTLSLTTVPRADGPGVTCLGRTVERVDDAPADGARILNAVADPVYVLDAAGRSERVNDAFVEYTGYERAELVGRRLAELLPASGYEQATSTVLDLVESDQESATFEVSFITKDGEQRLTEANTTPLSDEDGTYAGAVGVLRDITARVARERNLTMLKQVLMRVFRHNVRNELLIAKGHTELLDEEIDEDLREHTAKILETADRLLNHSEKARLIEQVIETDQSYERDITETVSDVVDQARERYPDASIDVDLPASATIEAHPDIERAVEELVENAVEHAPSDSSPHVEVWLDSRDQETTLFVEDESGGLSDHERSVLERGAEDDLKHSNGVGLWLIRWLVEYSDAEMIIHRTDEGSLMGIRFGERARPATEGGSPLAETPAHVRDIAPEAFHGDTVIERVEARNRLDSVYDSLSQTGGHSVLVTGEAGIGKTTLIEQFRERLSRQSDPPLFATGSCESETRPPYHAFRQAMADLPTDRDVGAVLAEAASLSVDGADELSQRRQALFADLAVELRRVAEEQPVVFVIEDMQWADRVTVDLFAYLTEEVGKWGHPVMFLGTYRTSEVDQAHPILEIADETAAAGRGTVVKLEPFGRDEVAALLSHMLDAPDVPEAFVGAVFEHTGGTPLFVNELCRHLAETLRPVADRSDLPASLADVSVPETVESAVADRLAALPDEVRPVLGLAAVIGREFSFDVLRAASDRRLDRLIECSHTLVRRQVWSMSTDGIEFIHGVVRDQTLATIPDDQRERLHARVTDALETVYEGELDEHAAELGTHYEAVGEYETAFEYYGESRDHQGDRRQAERGPQLQLARYRRTVPGGVRPGRGVLPAEPRGECRPR